MAKLGAVIDGWMKQANVTISAVQCWTSMEEFFGVVPCTIMSMMSNDLIPSACEVDVPGTLSMYMLALASGTPSALLDWNNNYGSNPDKCVCFHCSNLPKHFFKDVRMDYQEIIAGTVGKENTFGTCVGRVKAGAMSYARFSTDDRRGIVRGYTGAGKFTDDPLDHLRRRGRCGDSAVAKAAEIHLPRGLRAPRCSELQRRVEVHSRSSALHGLGEPLPSRARGLSGTRKSELLNRRSEKAPLWGLFTSASLLLLVPALSGP